jgi:hypothetical protein
MNILQRTLCVFYGPTYYEKRTTQIYSIISSQNEKISGFSLEVAGIFT